MFLERGVVTVPERVPDWSDWLERVPPAARLVMEEHDPGRQWTTAELVTQLGSRMDLPPWMNQWTLASLIRADGELLYLGRNVVALPDQATQRLRIGATAVDCLEAAGSPIAEDTLLVLMRERRGVSDGTWHHTRSQAPFILLDGGRIGLRGRDLACRDSSAP